MGKWFHQLMIVSLSSHFLFLILILLMLFLVSRILFLLFASYSGWIGYNFLCNHWSYSGMIQDIISKNIPCSLCTWRYSDAILHVILTRVIYASEKLLAVEVVFCLCVCVCTIIACPFINLSLFYSQTLCYVIELETKHNNKPANKFISFN